MDIYCQKCGEPWDAYHLRHDAPYEGNWDSVDVDCLLTGAEGWDGKLSSPTGVLVKAQLTEGGYKVGVSVYDLQECPCCPKAGEANRGGLLRHRAQVEYRELAAVACDMLDGDDDAIACELEDLGVGLGL